MITWLPYSKPCFSQIFNRHPWKFSSEAAPPEVTRAREPPSAPRTPRVARQARKAASGDPGLLLISS